jgi:hypothetical protein
MLKSSIAWCKLRWIDSALFIWLYRRCPRILDAISIVRPETVVRWHRKGIAAHWRWKARLREVMLSATLTARPSTWLRQAARNLHKQREDFIVFHRSIVPPNSPPPVFNNPQHRRAGCWENSKAPSLCCSRLPATQVRHTCRPSPAPGSVEVGRTKAAVRNEDRQATVQKQIAKHATTKRC